jgi:2'-5' RNA ligase
LKFLGNVKEYYLNTIHLVLHDLKARHKSFSLEWDRFGFFQKKKQPSVLWHGIKSSEQLTELQIDISDKIAELGLGDRQNKFSPHLTIARVKKCSSLIDLSELFQSSEDLSGTKEEIRSFVLVKSRLNPDGPKYHVLDEYFLSNEDNT